MVESLTEYQIFLEEVSNHDILLYAISTDHTIHPVISIPSLVFIKDLLTKKIYYFSFKHPDAPRTVDKLTFINDINNIGGLKWVIEKKSFFQMFHIFNLYDVNLALHLKDGKSIDQQLYDTEAHKFIYRSKRGEKNLNNAIPLFKHQEKFDLISQYVFDKGIFKNELDSGFIKENEIIIETLAELESHGMCVNPDCFKQHFDATIFPGNKLYSQYNIYTSTGRPSNHFENVNYAALNKENGARKCFISRYGINGKMILIDYSAFHPRIICQITGFDISVDIDIYKYLGEIYFGREVTEYDMDAVKDITLKQINRPGGPEKKYENIKFFTHLTQFINDHWKFFKMYGYVLTPFYKRKITAQHIADPNPNKLFNYILQATETEIAIQSLRQVQKYLTGRKTKTVLYTYDSILFDFHKKDGGSVLNDIIEIMKMGNRFPVKVYAGNSYHELDQIYP